MNIVFTRTWRCAAAVIQVTSPHSDGCTWLPSPWSYLVVVVVVVVDVVSIGVEGVAGSVTQIILFFGLLWVVRKCKKLHSSGVVSAVGALWKVCLHDTGQAVWTGLNERTDRHRPLKPGFAFYLLQSYYLPHLCLFIYAM